jgi:hypothetical protein
MAFSKTVNASALKIKHGQEQNATHHLAMHEEIVQLSHYGIRLVWNNKLERSTHGYQEPFFVDDM